MTLSSRPSSTLDVDDPFRGDIACTVPLASWDHVSRTLDEARKAAAAFRETSVGERIALCEGAVRAMEESTDAIAADISRMMGKPLRQARNEVAGMAMRARHMMSIAEESLADIVLPAKDKLERRIAKEPLGVVLDLPAWNYPLLTAVNCIVPAVLAGNAVIVKHSPRSPLAGEHFAEAFRRAGAPAHLVAALHCDHSTSERMVADGRLDHVVFTGSVYGGHRIAEAAATRFVSVGLELGGNDAAYVAADCDFQNTVDNIVDGAIYNAGQSCCAVERVYVHQAVYDRFVAACEGVVKAYVLGDPLDEATTLGPVAQPWHVAELEALVEDATRSGATLVCGGRRASVGGRGRFFEATLLAGVSQNARLMQSESFGPIVAVAPVSSDEEALARMNDSRLGLTASVWTQDKKRAERFARALEVGTVYMNRCDAVDPALPWSGVKDSGRGWSLSALGFDQLTRPKALNFRLSF